MDRYQKPILFIIFNRPKVTRRVFKEIKKIRPSKLYIAADGPRENKKGERKKCEQTRKIVEDIDWDCEVNTLFRHTNFGCKKAVSGAINWLFEQEEQGIILEDDCVPDSSFFRFCDELLDRYADEEKVMTIGGNNFQPVKRTANSYYFSRYMHCWGWASWRRAWKHYDVKMSSWPEVKEKGNVLKNYFEDSEAIEHWMNIFDRVHAGNIDTWDHQWTYAIWKNRGLNILPEVNLISNIGFGLDATHTRNIFSGKANMKTKPLEFPLKHPDSIHLNKKADKYVQQKNLKVPFYKSLINRVSNFLG